MKKHFSIGIFLLFQFVSFAQNIKVNKFGDIKLSDFNPVSDIIEKDVAAIVLSDVGSTEFEGNNDGYFTLVYKRHKRVLIKKNNAFTEGTVKIQLFQFSSSFEENLDNLEAATYNIVDGKIVQTKLARKDLIDEKVVRNVYIKKFTLPELHENCIIEYKYTIKAPFNLRPSPRSWYFQDVQYPTLWTEYQIAIPGSFNYAIIKKGAYKKYEVDSSKLVYRSYTIAELNQYTGKTEFYDASGDAKWMLWAMKDVPAYKVQSFVANPQDHIACTQFQLHTIKYSAENVVRKIKSWFETSRQLLGAEDFGVVLNKEKNEWLEKELETITANKEGLEAAKAIFSYVRDKFTWTDNGDFTLSDDLAKIYKAKKGSAADANLLLTAMLYSKGFIVDPVILSSRGNGKILETTAILNDFDYVISRLKVDTSYYFLDASDNKNGFGKLPSKCYNGFARLIAATPLLINLSSDNNNEGKTTNVFIVNGEKGKMEASFTSTLGCEESKGVREDLVTKSTADFFKKITKDYTFSPTISNQELENEKNYDEPITVKYDMSFALGDEDIIYFNPLLLEATKENIFKAEKRIFNVEMPFKISETYILSMDVPTGYVVDEMPKNFRSKFNEDEGYFEYIAQHKDGQIQLRCKFQLNKANFEVEDYDSLREFFGQLVTKQAEQIVFKKIKK